MRTPAHVHGWINPLIHGCTDPRTDSSANPRMGQPPGHEWINPIVHGPPTSQRSHLQTQVVAEFGGWVPHLSAGDTPSPCHSHLWAAVTNDLGLGAGQGRGHVDPVAGHPRLSSEAPLSFVLPGNGSSGPAGTVRRASAGAAVEQDAGKWVAAPPRRRRRTSRAFPGP